MSESIQSNKCVVCNKPHKLGLCDACFEDMNEAFRPMFDMLEEEDQRIDPSPTRT